MNKFILTLLTLIFVTACATSKTIIGPDGTENLLISSASMELCYEKAREMCKGPYKIINSISGSTQNGPEFNLLVKCE